MADSTQTVIIEFQSDTSQLTPAVDKLTALGAIDEKSAAIFKQTNDQLKQRNALLAGTLQNTESLSVNVTAQQQVYNKLVASVKNLSGASKEGVKSLLKMSTSEVANGFKEAAVNVDDYVQALEGAEGKQQNAAKSTASLFQQLRNITQQLAALSAAGETEGEEFQNLAVQAGKLKLALKDSQILVSNLGSNAGGFKVFEAGIRGVLGGFEAATGASALFGDKNKELEEVLVRVNAVMALNAGLSEVLNLVRDEAALSTARVLIQERLYNAQIAVENGLQSESAIVRGLATVAQYALNLAMSLNPIGLVVIGIAAFITAIAVYASSAKKAAQATGELNAVLANTGHILEAGIKGVENANKVILSGLEQRSARESEAQDQDLRALKENNKQREDAIAELNAVILKNENSTNKDVRELVQKSRDQLEKIENDFQDNKADITAKGNQLQKTLLFENLQDQADNIQARLSLASKNSDKEFALQRQLAAAKSAIDIQAAGDDAAKVFAIRSQLARDLKDIDIAQAAVAQKQIIALRESALIQAQNESRAINDRTSQQEITAQKKLLEEQKNQELAVEGLKEPEKQAIRDKFRQQELELQRNFNQQSAIESIQDQISANNKVLNVVEIGEKDKLDLRVQNIILAASIEIEQNRGKVAKIKEIEGKRDLDIKAARLASIEDGLRKELQLQTAQQAAGDRNLEQQLNQQDQLRSSRGVGSEKLLAKQIGAQRLSLTQQLAIVDELTAHRLEADQKEVDANQKLFDQGLISQEDYNIKAAELTDKSAKDWEDGEKRKTDITKKETDARIQKTKELVTTITDIASQAVGILQSIYQQDGQAAQARIDAQRKGIQDLQDAGEITAKEALLRNKKLDIEQKKLQIEQAKRDKEIAIFNAIIGTARAVAQALPNLVLAGIAGALGLAEIAIIARTPLPKFKHGKKDSYEGPGIWGEDGAELMEKDGKMYLANKPTLSWLGASDKIYNPKETAEMIGARVSSNYYPGQTPGKPQQQTFDYDKFGKAVGDNIPQTGVGFDEQGMFEWAKTKQGFTKYLNKRRSWR